MGLIIENVRVVDVAADSVGPPIRLALSGGRIVAMGARGPGVRGATTYDARGGFVVPGLWDMHVHLEPQGFKAAFPLLLAHGVLGVRDMGGALEGLVALRDSVELGLIEGPRLVVAGRMVDGPTPDWPFRITVEDSAEAWVAVESLTRAGVDFVKVHQQLAPDVYVHVANAAQAAGLRYEGHAPRGLPLARAVELGQASFEHTLGFPPCWTGGVGPDPDSGACTNEALDEAISLLSGAGAWQDPTLIVHKNLVHMEEELAADDPRQRFLRPETKAFWDLQLSVNGPTPPLATREA